MRRPWFGVLCALLAGACGGAPSRVSAPREDSFRPRFVLVNWLGQGRFYVAKAIADEQGLLRVRYADGTEEWAERARIQEERIARGDHVNVLLRDSLPPWGGTVEERRGDRVRILFDAGGTAWVDLDRVEGIGPAPDSVRLPDARRVEEDATRPREESAMPAIDPSRLEIGATLTAIWVGRPFDAIVLDRRGDLLKVRWDGDGTVGWISVEFVREVFPKANVAEAQVGSRVRARSSDGHAYDAIVLVRPPRGKIHVRWIHDGTEADVTPPEILRVHPRAAVDAIREGAKVRVGWLGDVFDAEVLERRDDLVRIRWEMDGGEAWVETADVREIRQP